MQIVSRVLSPRFEPRTSLLLSLLKEPLPSPITNFPFCYLLNWLNNINLLTFVGACTTQWIVLIEICSENAKKKHWEISTFPKLYYF